ncbi:MAG: hypothetical protein IPJ77_17070 [Planctomycetes bacterium]|nr:hypothetical protein [Planctomycetota bacterium]
MPRHALLLLLSATLLLPGCDETDAVAVRVHLENDLTGTVTASALELPATGGRVVEAAQGAEWTARVGVVCNTGRFEDLSALKLADLTFAGGTNPTGLAYASVTLPRGEAATWPRTLVPLAPEERTKAAKAFDPSGKTTEIGATVKLEFTLPSAVVGNGVSGKSRGVRLSADGNVATLLVPIETALTAGDPIVWHMTWQK